MVISVSEFLIPVGQSRVSIEVSSQAQAQPLPSQVVEWMQALSIPPNVAVILRDSLSKGIEQYQATYGAIPRDPAVAITLNQTDARQP